MGGRQEWGPYEGGESREDEWADARNGVPTLFRSARSRLAPPRSSVRNDVAHDFYLSCFYQYFDFAQLETCCWLSAGSVSAEL